MKLDSFTVEPLDSGAEFDLLELTLPRSIDDFEPLPLWLLEQYHFNDAEPDVGGA